MGESTNPVLLYAVETCLQLTLAELNENLREIYVEAYTVPENIELIHKKTAVQLQKIFASYLPGYSASDFYEMEIGCVYERLYGKTLRYVFYIRT